MSASSKINESPSHFMVLEAISRGKDTVDKISSAVKLSKDEVSSIVNDLVVQRLATMVEKRRFFGKKMKIEITDTGKNLLGVKYQELKDNKQKLQQLYESGDKQQLQTFMDSNRMWMPFMLFSGILDVLFFTSMISMLGMAMNPFESSVVDSGAAGDASSSDTSAQDSGTSADGTDSSSSGDMGSGDMGSGDMGSGDMGSGDMGFGGFDGGGFDF